MTNTETEKFRIRMTTETDVPEVMKLYVGAREFMRTHGNPNQWGSSWPTEKLIRRDIERQKHYVCLSGESMAAVFYFDIGHDKLYDELEDGEWLKTNDTYGMIFRIAASGLVAGAASYCVNWAFRQCGDLRIDTREENRPMIGMLEKNGFQYCGHLKLSVRRAYQKI